MRHNSVLSVGLRLSQSYCSRIDFQLLLLDKRYFLKYAIREKHHDILLVPNFSKHLHAAAKQWYQLWFCN